MLLLVLWACNGAYRAIRQAAVPPWAGNGAGSENLESTFIPFPDEAPDVPLIRPDVLAEHQVLREQAVGASKEMADLFEQELKASGMPGLMEKMTAAYKRIEQSEAEAQTKTPLNLAEQATLATTTNAKILAEMKRCRDAMVRFQQRPEMGRKLEPQVNGMNQAIRDMETEISEASQFLPCVDLVLLDVQGGTEVAEAVALRLARLAAVDNPGARIQKQVVSGPNGVAIGGYRLGPVSDIQAFARKIGTYEKIVKRRIYLKNPSASAEDLADLQAKNLAEEQASKANRDREQRAQIARETPKVDRAVADLKSGDNAKVGPALRRLYNFLPSNDRQAPVTRAITTFVDSTDKQTRLEAVRALARWAGTENLDTLHKLLPQVEGGDRKEILVALVEISDVRSIPYLAPAADEWTLRSQMTWLFRKHPAEAISALGKVLDDPQAKPNLKRGALDCLAAMEVPEALPPIEKMSKSSPDRELRSYAETCVIQARDRLKNPGR